MTPLQLEVLGELYAHRDTKMPSVHDERMRGYVSPMVVGGRDASHHSRVLRQLVRLGFAERWKRSWEWSRRGSWLYRITRAGGTALGHTTDPRGSVAKGRKR